MCGKSACTVRRGEGPKPIGPSYPYLAPGVRQLGEVVEERGRVVEGRRGQGVEADGHGADVPEEVV